MATNSKYTPEERQRIRELKSMRQTQMGMIKRLERLDLICSEMIKDLGHNVPNWILKSPLDEIMTK